MANKKYYEMVERAISSYSWIIEAEEYVFENGEEKEFAKFLKAWTKTVKDLYSMDISDYKESLMRIFINNLTTLNWKKVWLNIDPTIYINDNKFVFKYLMKQIDFSDFKEKINKCDDLVLVYNFYKLFADVNNIPFEKLCKLYAAYVDKLIKRTNSSYEYELNELLKQEDIDIGKDYSDIMCILMKKANLNYPVPHTLYSENIITLGAQIADYLSYKMYPNENEIKTINAFLNTTNEMYFDISCLHSTDICDLNIIAGNIEDARRIFNSDEYQLYSQEQLDVLTKNREYRTEGYGYPVDRLYNLINHAISKRDPEFIKELLYSDKVKMINAKNLFLIENALDNKEEYVKYLAYLVKNNKIIYADKNKVTAFNNMREVLEYLNARFNDAFDKDSYERIIDAEKNGSIITQ